jgi:hypothetical protein
MRNSLNSYAAATIVACCLQSACGREATRDVLLSGSLRNAIEEVGFGCDRTLDSSDIAASGQDWRVSCGESQVYLVSVRSADGAVCVEPISNLDDRDTQPAPASEVRCTAPDTGTR